MSPRTPPRTRSATSRSDSAKRLSTLFESPEGDVLVTPDTAVEVYSWSNEESGRENEPRVINKNRLSRILTFPSPKQTTTKRTRIITVDTHLDLAEPSSTSKSIQRTPNKLRKSRKQLKSAVKSLGSLADSSTTHVATSSQLSSAIIIDDSTPRRATFDFNDEQYTTLTSPADEYRATIDIVEEYDEAWYYKRTIWQKLLRKPPTARPYLPTLADLAEMRRNGFFGPPVNASGPETETKAVVTTEKPAQWVIFRDDDDEQEVAQTNKVVAIEFIQPREKVANSVFTSKIEQPGVIDATTSITPNNTQPSSSNNTTPAMIIPQIIIRPPTPDPSLEPSFDHGLVQCPFMLSRHGFISRYHMGEKLTEQSPLKTVTNRLLRFLCLDDQHID